MKVRRALSPPSSLLPPRNASIKHQSDNSWINLFQRTELEIIVCTNNHIITMTASVMPGVHSLISRSDIYVLTLCHYVMISRYQGPSWECPSSLSGDRSAGCEHHSWGQVYSNVADWPGGWEIFHYHSAEHRRIIITITIKYRRCLLNCENFTRNSQPKWHRWRYIHNVCCLSSYINVYSKQKV